VAAWIASWERRDGSVRMADVVPYWRSELATTDSRQTNHDT